jgi:ribosome-binding protein aMBF1 (putative translation factor)
MIVRGVIGVNWRPLGMPRASPTHAGHPVLVAFGRSIKQARAERGVSQEELAHLAGIDRSYMSSIERGEQNVGLMSMNRVAEALGITLSELVLNAKL